MYICVYMCVYIHTYIYIYVYMYMYMYMYIYIYVCVYWLKRAAWALSSVPQVLGDGEMPAEAGGDGRGHA